MERFRKTKISALRGISLLMKTLFKRPFGDLDKTPTVFGFFRLPQMDAPLADLQCYRKGGGRVFGLCRMLISQSKTKGRLEKKMLRNKEDNTFLTFFSFWQS